MRRHIFHAVLILIVIASAAYAQESQSPLVRIDEDVWVTFYDVPSRRFRAIRDAFVSRDFESAGSDLVTSANYLAIEAERALPEIGRRLHDVSAQMTAISGNFGDPTVTTATLDRLFGRAHWLLAQHYLYLGRLSRDRNDNRTTGRYLIAATHHLERSVLWSNARIDRKVVQSLDGLRDLAAQLQDPQRAARSRAERPVARAEALLRELGKTIDRPVVLPEQ